MKQIIIGDIHGLNIWKKIIEIHDDADRFIFIGDYVDAFDIGPLEQLENLREIISFKESNSDKVVLLIGNHDYHYFPNIEERYSGYQPKMRPSFEYEYSEYRNKFKMAFIDEYKNIYSHAGISKTFIDNLGVGFLKNEQLVDFINEMWIARPYAFGFSTFDRSGYGDHKTQSPIWIRPNSLVKDKIENTLIVGHTQCGEISNLNKSHRKGVYQIDALYNGFYLINEDGKFKIAKL